MRFALIVHDEKEPDLIPSAEKRQDDLERFELMAAGTTGQRLIDTTGLDIKRKQSGSLGGDIQTDAEIASETCNGVIFLHNPLIAQPHEPDITALLRIYDVHQTPLTISLASADAVLDELI